MFMWDSFLPIFYEDTDTVDLKALMVYGSVSVKAREAGV